MGRWITVKSDVQMVEKSPKTILNPLFTVVRTYLSRYDEEQKEKRRRTVFNN